MESKPITTGFVINASQRFGGTCDDNILDKENLLIGFDYVHCVYLLEE